MTLVFDGNITYPSGINTITIPLQTPYMHTPGNLVMMVQRPMDTQYYSSSDNFYGLTIGTNRTLKVQSDSTPYDPANPPTGTTPVGQVPKTTIFYTGQQIINDLACLSITGSSTPNVGSPATYTITVKNNGTATQTNYTVKLMKEGGVQIASVPGTSIASLQTATFNLSWTPTAVGTTYLYGVVELAGDEIATNNQTANLTVQVMEAGLTIVQIGQGTSVNSSTDYPTPYGTYYKNFRQQYLYTAADIYAAGGAPGLITALAFNVTSVNNCSAMPNYTIKVKHTDQTRLTTTFEVGDYTTVWNNANFLPTTGWNVHTFTTPFFWNGASNLLIDICTDLIPGNYTENASVPYTPTSYPSCLWFKNDTQSASSATTGTTSTNRANARLFMTISDMGSLTGVVSSAGAPLEGASVTVIGTVFHTVTAANGVYNFQYVPVGTQQVMATKHGYNEVTYTVTIVEDQTTTQNFELTLLPQVTVSGRIVGSDQHTVGLAGATIALSGYEPYEATTNATGNFTIPNVFANQTYNYVATAVGYQPATGQVVVGTTNVNMGDIIVNEMAYPPHSVVAQEAANFSNVTVTWQPPNPNVENFTDDFESYTDFSLQFDPWTLVDVDQSATYGLTGITWLHAYEAQAYIIFNPTTTTPALTTLTAHSGNKMAACFASTTLPNNDWMISPQVTIGVGNVVKFWARSYTADYGLERFKVGVSTTGTAPANFTIISGTTYVEAPVNWTEFTYDLSAYAGQQVYVGIQCVSNDAFIFLVDDVLIGTPSKMLTVSNRQTVTPATASVTIPRIAGTPMTSSRIVNNNVSAGNAIYPKSLPPAERVSYQTTENNRVLLGYRVYRLLAADQGNEANWTTLTPSNITPTTYVDNTWQPLPSGVYKFAVKAVYSNNVFSNAAFSNEIHKGMMGNLTGIVTDSETGFPIQGAVITAGEYSGQSDATGLYSFNVYAGTYTVTCTKTGCQPGSQAGVVIVGMQTTIQNFELISSAIPNLASDLFFSEYVEGTSYNKALEIFNGTGNPVNLSDYTVKLASNGGTWSSTYILNMSGVLDDGDVYVIANSQAEASILQIANVTSTVTSYNGNDVVGLFNGTTLIDIIGVYQQDPGAANWPVAGTPSATAEHTLIRKPTVNQGNTDFLAGAGTNPDDSEWIVHPQNYFADLGQHTFNHMLQASSPTFNPPPGIYGSPINVTISSTTPDAEIRYTIDGSIPNINSELYINPIYVSNNTAIKAKAFAPGMYPSFTATVNYTFPDVPEITQTINPLVFTMNGPEQYIYLPDYFSSSVDIVYSYFGNQNILLSLIESATLLIQPMQNWFGTEYITIRATNISGYIEQVLKVTVYQTGLVIENYNHNGAMPDNWTIQHSGTTTFPWQAVLQEGDNYLMKTLATTGGTANERLFSPVYNLTIYKEVQVSFDSDFLPYGSGTGSFAYTLNNVSYTVVETYSNSHNGQKIYSLPALDGKSSVKFRWQYNNSTANTGQNNYWTIDNFSIYGVVRDAEPPIAISGLNVVSQTNYSALLSWNPISDLYFGKYELYISIDDNVTTSDELWSVNQDHNLYFVNTTQTNIDPLADGEYWIAIRAVDQSNNASPLSEPVYVLIESISPVLYDPIPTGQPEPEWSSNRIVTIGCSISDWNNISSIQYRIDANGNGIYDETETWQELSRSNKFSLERNTVFVTTNVEYNADGVLAFEIKAIDFCGNVGYSGYNLSQGIDDDWVVRIDTTPPVGINNFFVQQVFDNSIVLSWTAISDLSFAGYRIYYATNANVSTSDLLWDSSNDPNLAYVGEGIVTTTITGLSPATRYYFILQAVDEAGWITQYPNVITGMTTSSAPPSAPQNLVITITGTDILLNWDEVTTDTMGNSLQISYYEIYVSDQPYFECDFDTLIGSTEVSEIFLEGAAEYADRLFFKVKAISGAITKEAKW